jgi:hypothetical protein
MKIETLIKIHGDRCHWCGIVTEGYSKKNPRAATKEHLIDAYSSPTGKRVAGSDNCVVACYKCNSDRSRKFETDPVNKEFVITFNYRKLKKHLHKIRFDHPARIAPAKRQLADMEAKYEFLKNLVD